MGLADYGPRSDRQRAAMTICLNPARARPGDNSLMTDAFANRLRKNVAHWRKWARRRGISCFRVYDRDVPQFPFAIDWFETVSPRGEIHLHVQEIDTGWKMSDSDYTAWLVAV